jgi:uncharacterized protein YndB with AHSA1/START domain
MPGQSQAAVRTNLEIDRGAHTIRFTRVFAASPAQIFEAWTRPEHVACWWDTTGERLAVCEIDLRKGGSFRFVTRGHPEMPFEGTYREISPPDRLEFGAMGASTGRVLLQDVDGGTRMTVEIVCGSAEHLDQFLKMGVDGGTTKTLDNLVDYAQRTWR